MSNKEVNKQEEWEKELEKLYESGIPMGDGITMENPYLRYGKEQITHFIRSLRSKDRDTLIESFNVFLKDYSEGRPISPARLRVFLEEITK